MARRRWKLANRRPLRHGELSCPWRSGEIRGGSSWAEAATKGNTGALPQSPAGLSLVTDKTDNYPLRSGVN